MKFISENLQAVLGSIVCAYVILLIPMFLVSIMFGLGWSLGEFQLYTLFAAVPSGIGLAKYLLHEDK